MYEGRTCHHEFPAPRQCGPERGSELPGAPRAGLGQRLRLGYQLSAPPPPTFWVRRNREPGHGRVFRKLGKLGEPWPPLTISSTVSATWDGAGLRRLGQRVGGPRAPLQALSFQCCWSARPGGPVSQGRTAPLWAMPGGGRADAVSRGKAALPGSHGEGREGTSAP